MFTNSYTASFTDESNIEDMPTMVTVTQCNTLEIGSNYLVQVVGASPHRNGAWWNIYLEKWTSTVDWDFQDLETQEGGKYATCLEPVKHTGSAWSLTNGKGQFPETLPDFTKVKKCHEDIWYLKVLAFVKSSLWGK